MDLFDLKIFITVADFNSMNKAAKLLYISQSAVSSRIANLELELGTPLFTRSKSGVTLTEYGKSFYHSSVEALNIINKSIKNMNIAKT